ncbi:retinal pigment epithelial membrane protein-domain-containing protein [Aspergillus navahoensis]
MSSVSATDTVVHFNDRPNEQGISHQQRTAIELSVTGYIPHYAADTLYRTGPGRYKVDKERGNTFQLDPPKNPDSSTHDMIVYARKTGSLDPCEAMYLKVQSTYEPRHDSTSFINTGKSNASGGIKPLTAKTDNSTYKQVHHSALEPLATATQATFHPELTGPLSASHAYYDPRDWRYIQLQPLFLSSGTPTYRVFRVSIKTAETSILATFTAPAAYPHSFFLAEDYAIFWSYIEVIKEFDNQIPARWYVVDRRHCQGLVAVFESPARQGTQTTLFPSQTDIIAECITYENTDDLHQLYHEYLVSSSSSGCPEPGAMNNGGKMQTRIARFRLPAIPAASPILGGEAEKIKPLIPYTYAVTDRGLSTFVDGVVKFDSLAGKTKIWSEHAQSPREASFVADPDGNEGYDGVLLNVVLDGRSGRSYLLVLDAGDMKKVGRASVDAAVGFGFHGVHISGNGVGRVGL